MVEKVLDRRYRITNELSQGGFGQTFLAQDLKRPGNPICVVKQLKPKSSESEVLHKARELFDREAKTLEKLGEHPQIPRLLAYFQEDNEFYLVQEYIEGETLLVELQQFLTLSESQVITLIAELLTILQFVHDRRVIHRDIAPKNIIRRKQDRKLVLIDFGAVKEITNLGGIATQIGSPGYFPREQYDGRPNYCSDLYAVGIIAIEALTGINPNYSFANPVLETNNLGEIVWSNSIAIDKHLAAFLSKMVRPDESDRYQSATEALNALKSIGDRNATVVASSSKKTNPRSFLPKKLKYGLWLGLIPIVILLSSIGRNLFSDRNLVSNLEIPLNGKVVKSTLNEKQICRDLVSQENLSCQKYTFSARSGQKASIEMNSDDFDPFLILQQPDGNKLAINGDISPANWNAKIVTDLDEDGDYTIVARTTATGESGNYTIRAVVK